MNKITETDFIQQPAYVDQLGNLFLEAWIAANGVSDIRVEVLIGERCFAILIESAFTEAERQLAKRERADNHLRQYLSGLMDVISEEAIAACGKIVGRQVSSVGTDINFEQDWVMWYVKLEDPHP